jgi:hypothetical protein
MHADADADAGTLRHSIAYSVSQPVSQPVSQLLVSVQSPQETIILVSPVWLATPRHAQT